MSNRQRYFVRHRKGGKTSIYLGGIAKETLNSKDKYMVYIRDLISSEGTCMNDTSIVVAFGPWLLYREVA